MITEDETQPVSVCIGILAAGKSERMGFPKLVYPFAGSTLLQRAVHTAEASQASSVAVIVGAYADLMRPLLAECPVDIVRNDQWAEGQASSVRCAIAYARSAHADACLLMVADQPFVTGKHLDALIKTFAETQADICYSMVRSTSVAPPLSMESVASVAPALSPQPPSSAAPPSQTIRIGNPCLFSKRCFDRLMALTGDQGARPLLRDDAYERVGVLSSDTRLFVDIDTPEEFEAIEAALIEADLAQSMTRSSSQSLPRHLVDRGDSDTYNSQQTSPASRPHR